MKNCAHADGGFAFVDHLVGSVFFGVLPWLNGSELFSRFKWIGFVCAVLWFSCGEAIGAGAVPVIVIQPSSQTAVVGYSANLTVEVSGTEPFVFQWFKNGLEIDGATNRALSVPNVQFSDAAAYSIKVTNAFGFAASSVANLNVVAVEITRQPRSQVRSLGENAKFEVEARGIGSLGYQWFKNLVEIQGAISPVLVLTDVTISEVGRYHIVVSNSLGSVVSESVGLIVTYLVSPPLKLITDQPHSQTVKLGTAVTFRISVSSSLPVSYQWFKDGERILSGTNQNLVFPTIRASDSGDYKVAVFTSKNGDISKTATLIVDEAVPPKVIVQPTGQTNEIGREVTFAVQAIGLAPLAYQWLRGGFNITGATASNLTIGPLETSDAGFYSVLVTNRLGRVASSAARLVVLLPPSIRSHPTDRSVLAGSSVSFLVDPAGTLPFQFRWLKDGEIIPNATNRSLSLNNVQKTNAGKYRVEVVNLYGAAISSNAVLTVNFPAAIVNQPVSQSVFEGTQTKFEVEASGTPPLTYQWTRNSSALRDATNSILHLVGVSTNDAGKYQVAVRNSFRIVTSSVAALTVNPALLITRQPKSTNIVEGSNITLFVEVSGARPIGFQWIKDKELIPGATNASLRFSPSSVSDSGVYSIFLSNSLANAFSSNVILRVRVPAAIVDQPVGRMALAGEDVAFRVGARGDPPIFYHWFRMGTNLPYATNAALNVTNVQYQDSADYFVVVSNALNTVTSSNVFLTVDSRPVFLKQPLNQRVLLGNDLVFTSEAGGRPPFRYEWFKDGIAIFGATNSFLPVTGVRLLDQGGYRVAVTAPEGSAVSAEAVLIVVLPIVITSQPLSQTVLAGADLTLTVEADALAPVSYRWMKDGESIAGEESRNLILRQVSELSAGRYSVNLQSEFGSVISSEAIVRVVFPAVSRGDIDGDGLPDIVFQNPDGYIAAWFMNGTDLRFSGFFEPDNSGNPDWRIAGSGDFNLDGSEDLLFQRSDASLAVWLLDGLKLTSAVPFLMSPVQEPEWSAAASADFNQDGKVDLLFQHQNGTMMVWYLDRLEFELGSLIGPPGPSDPGWRVVGAGDVDRDGKVDLVFQHTDGSLAAWYLNETRLISGSLLTPSHPGDPNWRVVGVADRNNDGKPDLLFQHAETGDLAVWFMDRNTLIEARLINPYQTGKGWKVVAP
ncbi:MAG: immunoglobulin domain-containing protein [Verrucomicrobia bacterium]|nr:immunoglobulin domain-containing protein [Verrucomicrobiota bacterium]